MAGASNKTSTGSVKKILTSMTAALTDEGNYHVLLITGLALSIFIIFFAIDIMHFPFVSQDPAGYILTLGETRHTVGVILALALIPLCALKKRFAFLAAALLGTVLAILCITHVIAMLIVEPPLYRQQIHGPIIWTATQLPVIYYGFKAFRMREEHRA
jgi:uncharacterized membrane protein